MCYYPKQNSHISEKVKAVLDLLNYAPKKELEHYAGVDTYDIAAKDFFALKVEADKPDDDDAFQNMLFYQPALDKKRKVH